MKTFDTGRHGRQARLRRQRRQQVRENLLATPNGPGSTPARPRGKVPRPEPQSTKAAKHRAKTRLPGATPMKHVVTVPSPKLVSASAKAELYQVYSWQDNLVWVLVCSATKKTAAIDGPEAAGVLALCEEKGLELSAIWNTHTHPDHIGINRDLKKRGKLAQLEVIGSASRASDVPGITRGVAEGDTLTLGELSAKVMLTEGHVDGHISFLCEGFLFCGDTLFAGGCGYLFDGPPRKMQQSLERLRGLPDDTWVCCAHEYTQDNLTFAWSIGDEPPALRERIQRVWATRSEGKCVVPSRLGEEKATNPFLRFDDASLVGALRQHRPDADLSTAERVFAETRALKDSKEYRNNGAEKRLPLESLEPRAARATLGQNQKEPPMVVVTNRIPVAEGYEIDFEDRFRKRVHLVDQAPGFVRNEVHRPKPMKFSHEKGGFVPDPDKQGYYEVKTWWKSMQDFENWVNSPAFAEAHRNRPPKEMFAGPNVLETHEVFLSTDDGDQAE